MKERKVCKQSIGNLPARARQRYLCRGRSDCRKNDTSASIKNSVTVGFHGGSLLILLTTTIKWNKYKNT